MATPRHRHGHPYPPLDPFQPERTWEEVVAEFNRRHPEHPMPSVNAARAVCRVALNKLRNPEVWRDAN